MKYILKEEFDFNNVISNNNLDINKSNVVSDIIINNINKNDIKNIINKILLSEYKYIEKIDNNIVIKKIDNSISIKIYYGNDKTKYVTIELRCINNIFYTYINGFGNTWMSVSKCTIQILNYLKSIMQLNISDVIRFGTNSYSSDNQFFLTPNGIRHILVFIENNYKIKLVDYRYDETDDNIGILTIDIFSNDKDKVDTKLLNHYLININKDTKISYYIHIT